LITTYTNYAKHLGSDQIPSILASTFYTRCFVDEVDGLFPPNIKHISVMRREINRWKQATVI